MKLPSINTRLLVLWLVLCAAGGFLLAWLADMPFWGGAVVVAFALVINGVVAEVEDRAPDGFLNPPGKMVVRDEGDKD